MQAPTFAPAMANAANGNGAAGTGGTAVRQLIVLAAYLKEMELQSHLVHLNYTGANFLGIHHFLKDQYDAHLDQFDTVAEYIRAEGSMLPSGNQQLRDALPQFDGTANLATYRGNLKQLIKMATNLEATATKERLIHIANYMAELVAAAGKAAWFIEASMC